MLMLAVVCEPREDFANLSEHPTFADNKPYRAQNFIYTAK